MMLLGAIIGFPSSPPSQPSSSSRHPTDLTSSSFSSTYHGKKGGGGGGDREARTDGRTDVARGRRGMDPTQGPFEGGEMLGGILMPRGERMEWARSGN